MNSQIKRDRAAKHRSFCPCGAGVPTLPACRSVQPSSSLNLYRDVYEGFITQTKSIINSIPSPSPLSAEWSVEPKFPRFPSWLGFPGAQPPSRSPPGVTSLEQNHINITLAIPRDAGDLCQGQGQRQNIRKMVLT